MTSQSCGRVRWHGRKQRLEPCAEKLARTVLRGEGGGNAALLPDNVGNGADPSETITKYYRALGRLIAIRRNGILYWIGTDHLGGTIRVADSGFDPVGQMRYMPYGASRDDASLLPHDYLFTDQQLDGSIGLYWYASRAYDASLGRFTCPDTIVPSPGNPQSLNRYAYCANNPLRYADPSGHNPYDGMGIVIYDNPSYLPVEQRQALYEHNSQSSISNGSRGAVYVGESGGGGGGGGSTSIVSYAMLGVGVQGLQPWDPDWVQAFTDAHGYAPVEQDWQDRQVSLAHPGTGPNGTWTDQDWQVYSQVQDLLGAELMNQIGKKGPSGADAYTAIGMVFQVMATSQGLDGPPASQGLEWRSGPDGTRIAVSEALPPGTGGITFGNLIVLPPASAQDPATVVHEYVHVLQYRATGVSYGVEYAEGGFYSWQSNPLEVPAVNVEKLYRANPWLPAPWEMRWTGHARQWIGPR